MAATALRIGWTDVPEPVRRAVDARLGSSVVATASEPGGFSPSFAARCRLADGRRFFIKAVSPDQNPQAVRMLRHEVRVTRELPPGFPAPRLRETLDDGHWVVAVFDELDAVAPRQPWDPAELASVLDAIDGLGAVSDPCPVAGLPTLEDQFGPLFTGWRTLAGALAPELPDLDPWTAGRLDDLAALEAGWVEACAGDALVHFDIRADNVLLGAGGEIWFVDWANAGRGASWVDTVLMLPSVTLQGGPPPATVWATTRACRTTPPDAVTALVVAVAGYFTRSGSLPPPPGLPHLRAFQAAQGEVARAWVGERLGAGGSG